MRFYLDNDVDARCRRVLTQAGHDCWTAAEAGLANAEDDAQAVYAQDHHAVLVTHDRRFTNRQKRRTVGHHVYLGCEQPDGPALLARWLDYVIRNVAPFDDCVIELTHKTANLTPGQWPSRRSGSVTD